MILTTTENIPNKSFEILGVVEGGMVQTKHLGKDIMNGLKTIVGGELVSYTAMMNESRTVATNRMIESAEKLGADAIVNVRYVSSSVMQGASEILAYGTAVKFVE